MKKLMALAALAVLTACDYAERFDIRKERADRLYQSAMEDYRAGRIDAAVEGFRGVVRKDPSNASARFQLACLLQDAKADYLGAFCGYREYLSQHPESDKSRLANDRLAKCELELAKFLQKKHGLDDKGGFVKENTALKADLQSAEVRLATLEKEAEALRVRVTSLSAERERLLGIVKGGMAENVAGAATPAPSVREARALLEEEEEEVGDRIKMSADVAALRVEERNELSTGSDILPVKTGDVTRVTAKAEPAGRHAFTPIPETHVVQEGDTLYGIAKRYYGRLSAWKMIRDANKALISADNRLRAGDKLKLPRLRP